MSVFDFLNPEEKVEIVTSEGFSPSGFIGKIMARTVWSFWSQYDIDDKPDGLIVSGRDGSWWYYHKDYDTALELSNKLDSKFKPRQVWRFEMDINSVLNIKDTSKFGSEISGNVSVSSLFSKKYRHELHLVSLPLAVQAMALAAGFVDKRIFDVNELFVLANDEKEKEDKDKFAKESDILIGGDNTNYKESTLWLRRTELWKALGEENPEVYNPIGGDTKFDTTSKNLSKCLSVLTNTWTKPIWGKLMLVPDPRVDAVYGNEGKRLSIPALYEVYKGEEEARQAAGIDENAQVTESEPDSEGLAIPSEWRDVADEWKQWVSDLKATHGELPKLPPQRAKLLSELAEQSACKPEELEAWWDKV